MNDPHVKAIHYFVEHDDVVDYRGAAPLAYDAELFRIQADKGEVVLEPKKHYATEEEARNVAEGLVRRWEFEAGLRTGSRSFKLSYARVEIVDRSPLPLPLGVAHAGPVNFHFRVSKAEGRVAKMPTRYPSPPSDEAIDPDDRDASFMLSRLDLYRQGREPLGSVATLPHRAGGVSHAGNGGKRRQTAIGSQTLPDRNEGPRPGWKALGQ